MRSAFEWLCVCVESIKRTFHVTDPCGTQCGKWTRTAGRQRATGNATCGQNVSERTGQAWGRVRDALFVCPFTSFFSLYIFYIFHFALCCFHNFEKLKIVWPAPTATRSTRSTRGSATPRWLGVLLQRRRHCVQLHVPLLLPVINCILCRLSRAACQRSSTVGQLLGYGGGS